MVRNRWFQKRMCPIPARPVPIPSVILINPRSRPSSVCIYSGRQLNVRSVRDVCPDVNGVLAVIHLMRNAVSQVSRIHRRKVFCIPFRLFSAPFQRPQNSIVKLAQHISAVIVEYHASKIRHGFSPIFPTVRMSFPQLPHSARFSGLSRAFCVVPPQFPAFLLCAEYSGSCRY